MHENTNEKVFVGWLKILFCLMLVCLCGMHVCHAAGVSAVKVCWNTTQRTYLSVENKEVTVGSSGMKGMDWECGRICSLDKIIFPVKMDAGDYRLEHSENLLQGCLLILRNVC